VVSVLLVPGVVILMSGGVTGAAGAADAPRVAQIPVVPPTTAPATQPAEPTTAPTTSTPHRLLRTAKSSHVTESSGVTEQVEAAPEASSNRGEERTVDSVDATPDSIGAESQSAVSTQPTSAPATTKPAAPTLDRGLSQDVRRAIAEKSYACSAVHGGGFANYPFEDVSSDGVLIGFRIGLGKFFDNDTIKFIQPIFLTPRGERLGRPYGKETNHMVVAKAPAGYAVGAARIGGGGGLDSLTLTYMRMTVGSRLNKRDAYVTPRIGGPAGEVYIGGDGTPIIGVCGRVSEKRDWLGLGFVFIEDTLALKPH
jgi:hypothetical protein